MKRKWRITLVVLLWAAMCGWLIRFEAFPGAFSRTDAGYRNLLEQGLLIRDSWMKILFQGASIGYSYTRVNLDESSKDGYCLVENVTMLSPKIMGQMQKVSVNAVAALDRTYRLHRFEFSLASHGYSMRMEGTRVSASAFDVGITTGGKKETTRIDVPADAVLYSPMTEMAMKQLRPGQRMSIKAFDPTSLTTADIVIDALRAERLFFGGRPRDTVVLSTEYRGMQILSWVDADGEVLRQETPFGWTMVACTAEEALVIDKARGGPEDLLTAMAVPVKGTIRNPRDCRQVRLRLSGASLAGMILERGRQTVEETNDLGTALTVRADRPPSGSTTSLPSDCMPFLAATPFIQSDNPQIVSRARSITRGMTNGWDQAVAICDWVYRTLEKNPTVSIPSALEVLQRREGDCNEHTYLFVALARAAGFPSKVTVGLAYARGAFYYHAWPAIYVGRWVEMDPTFGQHTVDATHVALLEGELADQLRLLQVFGRLKIEVLGQEE